MSLRVFPAQEAVRKSCSYANSSSPRTRGPRSKPLKSLGSRFRGNECVREDALSARCKSVPEPVAGSVIEGNCVAARRGGEQPEVNRQSVEPAPAQAGDDEPDSA